MAIRTTFRARIIGGLAPARRWLFASLLLLGLGPSLAYGVDYETDSDNGKIEEMDLSRGTMIVDGRLYWTGPDLRVEINGTYGAFTLLKPGMFVEMEYRITAGEQRELYLVQEVTNSRFHEES